MKRFFLVMMGMLLIACAPPKATIVPPTAGNSGTISQGELGEVRLSSTTLVAQQDKIVDSPVVIASYKAERFEIYGYICYRPDGSPIYAGIYEASGGITPGSSLRLKLYSHDTVNQCNGTLWVKFYDEKGNVEDLKIPVNLIVE